MPPSAPDSLRPNWFHVLLALGGSDLHGSAIARAVLDQTDGELRLWPATLYRSLDELADRGYIRELSGDEHPEGASEKRRYYRMTEDGRAALRAAAEQMSSLADAALRRLEKATS